jgi:hypothetical protein
MLKRFILWDYPRASWQYDVMVGIIVAFIFLTPRQWFRDQPNPTSIAMLSSGSAGSSYFISHAAHTSDAQLGPAIIEMLRIRTGNRRLAVTRIEPVHNAEGELEGYVAFTRP